MTLLRCLVPALCAAFVFAPACAPRSFGINEPVAAPPLAATIARSGDLTIRRGDTDVVASVRAGLFEPGWAFRATSLDAATGTPRIVASTAGSTVAVKPVFSAKGNVVSVSVSFTADKDTPVNSVHVSVNLPVGAYVGGTATFTPATGDAKTFPVTASVGANRITDGANGAMSLAAKDGSRKIGVSVAGVNAVLLQDNRTFGGNELEIRVGGINEHILKAGQTETVTFTLLLPDAVDVEPEKPLVMAASADWIPLSPSSLDIVPGSALDFSGFLADVPAGKYGKLIVRSDGHFAFEKKNAPQRFYGVNLCFTANYLEHAEADALAERLMRLGYNSVRIHHYEGDLIDRAAPDSLTFRPEQLDKLDYLVAALKQRGIYIKTDLFVSRPVKPSEMGLTEGGADDFKDAVLVSRPAMANWKAFSKKLLTHVNPYTKLAYKDEPALAWVSLINEPNLTNGRLGAWKPDLRALFEKEWATWYAKRYPGKPVSTLPKNMVDDATGRDVAAFFAFLHGRGYTEMSGFLRNEVGTKALLTYLNGWSETPAFMVARQSFDFVDNHFYWDHPSFLGASWGLPSRGGSGGGSSLAAGTPGIDYVAGTRLWGKPFTVSEWDYVYPNPYRAEGSLVMGAVASLQDWDAVWHFAYSHGRDSVIAPRPADYFNMAQDPLRQASERTGILLFLRGDVSPVKNTIAANVSPEQLTAPNQPVPMLPKAADYMTTARYGVAFRTTDVSPQPSAPAGDYVPSSGSSQLMRVERDHPELIVNTDRTMLWSPTDTVGGASSNGTGIEIREAQTTVCISSLDGKPLPISKRILVTHLTDLQNTGETFSARDRQILEKWGDLPYLVRRGSATVTLTRPDAATLKAWRLDTTGKRIAPLPITMKNGAAMLELSTLAPDGSATLYYEVVAP